MKSPQKGFIQLPILISVVAGLLLFSGVSYFGFAQFQDYRTEQAEKEAQYQAIISSQLEALTQVEEDVEPTQESVETDEINSVNNKEQSPSPTTFTTPKIEEIKTEVSPSLANSLYLQQAKSDIEYWQEAISEWQAEYKSKKKISREGIQACADLYDSRIQRVRDLAEREITAYLESRRGFASRPSIEENIYADMEWEIEGLEYEKAICMAKYYIDDSIPSKLSQLSSELSSIQRRLNIDNSIIKLEEIRLIGQKVIAVAKLL